MKSVPRLYLCVVLLTASSLKLYSHFYSLELEPPRMVVLSVIEGAICIGLVVPRCKPWAPQAVLGLFSALCGGSLYGLADNGRNCGCFGSNVHLSPFVSMSVAILGLAASLWLVRDVPAIARRLMYVTIPALMLGGFVSAPHFRAKSGDAVSGMPFVVSTVSETARLNGDWCLIYFNTQCSICQKSIPLVSGFASNPAFRGNYNVMFVELPPFDGAVASELLANDDLMAVRAPASDITPSTMLLIHDGSIVHTESIETIKEAAEFVELLAT